MWVGFMTDNKNSGLDTSASSAGINTRIDAILKRVPDKNEFVNELEYLIDEAYPEDAIKTVLVSWSGLQF